MLILVSYVLILEYCLIYLSSGKQLFGVIKYENTEKDVSLIYMQYISFNLAILNVGAFVARPVCLMYLTWKAIVEAVIDKEGVKCTISPDIQGRDEAFDLVFFQVVSLNDMAK